MHYSICSLVKAKLSYGNLFVLGQVPIFAVSTPLAKTQPGAHTQGGQLKFDLISQPKQLTYVVGTQKSSFNETVLLSTNNKF